MVEYYWRTFSRFFRGSFSFFRINLIFNHFSDFLFLDLSQNNLTKNLFCDFVTNLEPDYFETFSQVMLTVYGGEIFHVNSGCGHMILE